MNSNFYQFYLQTQTSLTQKTYSIKADPSLLFYNLVIQKIFKVVLTLQGSQGFFTLWWIHKLLSVAYPSSYMFVCVSVDGQLERERRPSYNKRNMQRLRGSERDLKLDLSDVQPSALPRHTEERSESLPPSSAFKVRHNWGD